MTDIARWDPFVAGFGPRGFRQMVKMMDEPFARDARRWDDTALPVDIAEADGKLVVRASLPGYASDDIDVQVNDGVLSINAKHSEDSETTNEKFYRRERRYGAVSRRIALPTNVHQAPVDAELKDGVLTLSIAVPEDAQPKQIESRRLNGLDSVRDRTESPAASGASSRPRVDLSPVRSPADQPFDSIADVSCTS